MRRLIAEIEQKYKVYHASGCSADEVITAEKELGIKFSDEYREYLMEYGAVSFGSNEFTGLGVDDYINVVKVTEHEKKLNVTFPQRSIVIQNLDIEGISIVQDEEGAIYQINGSGKKEFVADGFFEYLKTLI